MKKRIALFYNPIAGSGDFKNRLDQIIAFFQERDMQIIPWRITGEKLVRDEISSLNPAEYHSIIAAGGDGTLHLVANAMVKNQINIPLGIFPEGTCNDVAAYLKIPKQMDDYCRIITEGRKIAIDLGRIEDRYFINVASAGFITETAHEVNYMLKNVWGKMAYYLKGIEKIPRLKKLNLRLTADEDEDEYEMKVLLFLILNGGVAGGFRQMPQEGLMNDGLLDFIAIKPVPVRKLAYLVLNLSRGELINDPSVFYCQGKRFKIDLAPQATGDLDGELGPRLPWKVEVCPAALQLWVP